MKKLIIILFCFVSFTSNLSAQVLNDPYAEDTENAPLFGFGFRQFCCDKTTEEGADEVYFLIVGKRSDGKTFYEFMRKPGKDMHWDMNDGDQPDDMDQRGRGDSHCLTNRRLATFELPDGLSFNFTILVCEEDGGSTLELQKAAKEVLSKSDDPYSLSAAFILGVLNKFGIFIKDTDDYMGIFGVSVNNTKGNITTKWLAKEGIVHINPDPEDSNNTNRKEIRMNHDGSNYVGWFYVE